METLIRAVEKLVSNLERGVLVDKREFAASLLQLVASQKQGESIVDILDLIPRELSDEVVKQLEFLRDQGFDRKFLMFLGRLRPDEEEHVANELRQEYVSMLVAIGQTKERMA